MYLFVNANIEQWSLWHPDGFYCKDQVSHLWKTVQDFRNIITSSNGWTKANQSLYSYYIRQHQKINHSLEPRCCRLEAGKWSLCLSQTLKAWRNTWRSLNHRYLSHELAVIKVRNKKTVDQNLLHYLKNIEPRL